MSRQKSSTYETVFMARQPVFDRRMDVWGYRLLYRDSKEAQQAVMVDELEATLRVMTSVTLCNEEAFEKEKFLISFSEEAILVGAPYCMPPASTIVLVSAENDITRYYLEALGDLKASGYEIALSNFEGNSAYESLHLQANYLILDVLNKDHDELARLISSAQRFDVPLIAKRIEDHDTFDLIRDLGIAYFTGFFFKRPKNMCARKLSPANCSRLRLFEILKGDSPDFDKLAESIEADVSISHRLLALLNSPAFGFVQKVSTIRKAIVLAGWNQIRNWLRLLILTDMPAPEKTRELCSLAAQRAKFLELIACELKRENKADSYFLLGLFSLLEPMLDMPMPDILKHLLLEDSLKDALMGKDNEFSRLLQLVENLESCDWEQLGAVIDELQLDPREVENCYRQAICWSSTFFSNCS